MLDNASPYSSPSPPHYNLERKLKKPLMEKRRRARINDCLGQLKQLLLHMAPQQRSKLEKADILEMTVAYLHQLHTANSNTPLDAALLYRQSYADGFSACAGAVFAYLARCGEQSSVIAAQPGLVEHLRHALSEEVERRLLSPVSSASSETSSSAAASPVAAARKLWRPF